MVLAWAGPARAAAGSLDPSWGGDGTVVTEFEQHGWADSNALQADGRILVAGFAGVGTVSRDFAVVRYNTDGTLDSAFGSGGIVITDFSGGDDYARDVAVQTDGKIILGGSSDGEFGLARYRADGTLDSTFGTGGFVTTAVTSDQDVIRGIVIRNDGRIVVTGFCGSSGAYDFCLARYRPNGALDTTFGSEGLVITDIGASDESRGILITSGGKLVVCGFTQMVRGTQDMVLARYNANGTLDTTWDGDGIAVTDFGASDVCRAMALQGNGKVVAAGYTGVGGGAPAMPGEGDGEKGPSDAALARYNTNGSLDATFGTGGKVITDLQGEEKFRGVALQADGKIVGAGHIGLMTDDFLVVRYNTDGSLDTSFGSAGAAITDFGRKDDGARDVVIQADGKIVASGINGTGAGNQFATARYLAS